MKLPRGKPVLENVKVQFVNFDNVVNLAKRAREGRINGYIQIIYPDSVDFLFLRNGEVINAGRYAGGESKLVSIKEVLDRAKKAEVGVVNIYDIPDEVLSMIIGIFKEKPLFKDKPMKGVDLDKLFQKFQEIKFPGFIVLRKGVEVSFVSFEKGEPKMIYLAGRGGSSITREVLLTFLKKEGMDFFISAYPGTTKVEQATPAFVSLYIRFFNALIKEFSDMVGPGLVRKTLISALEGASSEHPLLLKFMPEDLELKEVPVVATPEEITKAFAAGIDRFVDGLFVVLGRRVENAVVKAMKDFRFALKNAGFFEHSKLKRYESI